MRILHVLAERGFSGGEAQLRDVLEDLIEHGHDNRLLLQAGAAFATTAGELGLPVESVRMRNGYDLAAVVAIRAAVRRHAPDLLHLACSRSHKLGALACLGRLRPVRVTTRRMDYPLRWRPWSRWLYGRAVHGTVAISQAVADEILRVGVPRSRIEVIHDGLHVERFADLAARRAEARRRLGLPNDALVVVCAASLTRRKAQIHLLRAWPAVRSSEPRAWLLLAGEGPERDALAGERERLGLQEVVMLPGRIAAEDAIAAADVACLPSLREGLSVFSLEAQAAGLPVVASAVGGLRESVADGESGILVPPGDEAALARALVSLLSDPAWRARMGEVGRVRVRERFSADRMVAATRRYYERLAGEAVQ